MKDMPNEVRLRDFIRAKLNLPEADAAEIASYLMNTIAEDSPAQAAARLFTYFEGFAGDAGMIAPASNQSHASSRH